MAIPWGPIIGAGVSAIGSLLGDDDEETTTTINYKMMARKAEQAGFNPLTAIRNGGSAGFTTTHHPGLSMADRFGQAFQTLGNAIMSFDARADERADLEQQLLQAQLERIQRQGQLTAGMEVPTAAGSTRSTSPARGGAGGGLPAPPKVGSGGEYQLETLGGTPVAGYEPVTEGDDAVVTIDQINRAVKKNWNRPGNMFTDYSNWRGAPYVDPPLPTPNPFTVRPRWPFTPTPGYGPNRVFY